MSRPLYLATLVLLVMHFDAYASRVVIRDTEHVCRSFDPPRLIRFQLQNHGPGSARILINAGEQTLEIAPFSASDIGVEDVTSLCVVAESGDVEIERTRLGSSIRVPSVLDSWATPAELWNTTLAFVPAFPGSYEFRATSGSEATIVMLYFEGCVCPGRSERRSLRPGEAVTLHDVALLKLIPTKDPDDFLKRIRVGARRL